jgi:hypothetical protein
MLQIEILCLLDDLICTVEMNDSTQTSDPESWTRGTPAYFAYLEKCKRNGYIPTLLELGIVLAYPNYPDPGSYKLSSTEQWLIDEYTQLATKSTELTMYGMAAMLRIAEMKTREDARHSVPFGTNDGVALQYALDSNL